MNDAAAEPAAQAERTALAWRRTALGVGAGVVVAARLAAPGAGPVAYVLVAVGGTATGMLFVLARQRYRAALAVLADPGAHGDPGPGLPAALVAGLAALAGLAGMLFVVTR